VVALVLAGGLAGFAGFLNHKASTNVRYAALLPSQVPSSAAGTRQGQAQGPAGQAQGQTPAVTDPARSPAAGDAQNILLVGSDARAGLSGARSDTIVLVHITSDRKKVYLVSFPRDLYVDVPGHGKDKVNAAFAYGGAPLLVQTLQGLVNVPIDHMAVIGFEGFKEMTDALGGIDVWAEEPSSNSDATIHVGYNHLDGKQALAFVRERMQLSEGDISRGRRQQAFVKALMLKALSRDTVTNPVRLAQLVDASTKYLTLDASFPIGDVRSQLFGLRDVGTHDVVFITAPFTGFGTSPAGASIDVVNTTRMAQLSRALRDDDMASYYVGKQIP